MALTSKEQLLLDEGCRITLTELTEMSGLSTVEVHELVALGVFEPEAGDREWRFTSRCIALARTARRLQADFELNLPGVALALTYLERIEKLEQRLRELECQLPRGN